MEFSVNETAGDRISLIPRPLTLPGCCAICGYVGTNVGNEGDVRVFIDWQLDVEFYGRVYLCSDCLLQASVALGWLGVKQAEELRAKVSEQESELIVLREQNERLRASLASLLGQPDEPVSDILFSIVEAEQQRNQDLEASERQEGQSDSSSDESSSESRSVGIPSDSSSGNSLGEFTL